MIEFYLVKSKIGYNAINADLYLDNKGIGDRIVIDGIEWTIIKLFKIGV